MNVKVFGLIVFFVGVFAEKPLHPWNSPPFRGKWPRSSRMKRSSQCYGDLGCFSNTFPYNNTGHALPLNPRFIRTRFFLFTTINERFPTILNRRDTDKLRRSRYDGTLPTKFIIHGFLQSGLVSWTRQMARTLIQKEPTNVIIVDWGHGSGWPYTQAAANTRLVGAEVAKMIEFLTSESGADIANFHLIGHSLGAHICGYAGEALTGLGRVTGLDPAEPNFKNTDSRVRLDPGDANFVDVIHTDGSAFDEISGYGLLDPVGDVDFYPNGGQNQPGCPKENWVNLFSQSYYNGVEGTADLMSCSHSRSIFLFIESINSDCRFIAHPCANFRKFTQGGCLDCRGRPCPIMGLSADKYESSSNKPRGKFYLATLKSNPFCGYTYGVEVHLSSGMEPTEGMLELNFHGLHGHVGNHTVYSPNFLAGEVHTDIFLSPSDLSSITRVTVRFLENNKIWSWLWAGRIQINKVAVTSGQNSDKMYFCGSDVIIQSGGSATLTVSPGEC